MGSSSKVILVGATSLIVGVYAISLKKAEADGVQAAMKNVKRVQSERIQDAAMRTALSTFVSAGGTMDKSGTFKALDGSTFTYSIKGARGATATLTLTTKEDGVSSVIIAKLVKRLGAVEQGARKVHRGPWEVDKVYFPNKVKGRK